MCERARVCLCVCVCEATQLKTRRGGGFFSWRSALRIVARGRLDGKLMEQGGEAASSPSAGYLLRHIYTKMTEFRIGLKFHE